MDTILKNKLRIALAEGQLTLHYQPKIDLNNGKICGLEALMRWNDPDHGLVSPAEFIPVLEETGLIIEAGSWALNQAMSDYAEWRSQGLSPPRIAVNVSQVQLHRDDFVDTVKHVLHDSGDMVASLEIEITESMVMHDVEINIQKLHAIRALGVHVSIDDFGTGYSSLSYLKRFPATSVKIDQSFVRDITSNPDDAAIARSIISIAHEMRLHVIAEGVETEGQLNFLSRHHCDQIQGYYVSKPLPAKDCAAFLKSFGGLNQLQTVTGLEERTLLVVDDEVNITTSIRRLMRGEGYNILVADSGKQGLELLATHPVGVIISDQRMPEMTGVEFLRRVKRLYPDTVRIVLSGYTDLKSITDAINEGSIYRFLTKPWEDEHLLSNVREAFQRYELRRENSRLGLELKQANEELSAINRDLELYATAKVEETGHSIAALQVSQEILEYLPSAVIGVDDEGLIVIANLAANHLFAQNQPPLLGSMASACKSMQFQDYQDISSGVMHQISLADGRQLNVICHRMGESCQSRGTIYVYSLA